jgi:antitoxin HicB
VESDSEGEGDTKERKYSLSATWSDEDGGYIAIIPEFPGLSGFGETIEQAVAEAKVALELFIETYNEGKEPLPEPQKTKPYSGQMRLRLPRSLHEQAARQAEKEGVSLNAYFLAAIAHMLGAHANKPIGTSVFHIDQLHYSISNNMQIVASNAPVGSTAVQFRRGGGRLKHGRT